MTARLTIILILCAAGLGLALRMPRLAERPMHCDEAVHAIKFERLWKHGEYIYDPSEYHGPTLYYATLPFAWLSGAATFDDLSETTLRAVPLLVGVLLIALTALVRDGLGRGGSIWAALLTAISPAFVYYSRYYIQEMLLVCFSFGLIACAWRFHRSRRIGWALAAGAFFGLTHATKETCLIAWGCMAIAAVAVRLLPSPHAHKQLRWPWKSVAAGLAVAALVSILFFTAFFTNLRGPADSIRTYVTYFDRAGNHGLHDHSWSFYWHRLLWWRYPPAPLFSEAPVLLAAAVGVFAIIRRAGKAPLESIAGDEPGVATPDGTFQRFMLFYTLLLAGVYTALPYKTPWCMLGFLHGFILLAGVGLDAIISGARRPLTRTVATIAVLACVWPLVTQAERVISRKFAADNRNPYVYAHTVNDLLNLVGWIDRIAAVHPLGRDLPIHVYATGDDFWPLPWYLRRYRNVGYWGKVPDAADAAVVVISDDLAEDFESMRRNEYPTQAHYGLRPGTVLSAYVDADAWARFRAAQPSANMRSDDKP